MEALIFVLLTLSLLGLFRFQISGNKPLGLIDLKKITENWISDKSWISRLTPIFSLLVIIYNFGMWILNGVLAIVDILKYLGLNKSKEQILVGFALETDNEIINAKSKISKKNLDAIVLNSLRDEGAGFGHDTNKISYINSSGLIKKFKLKSKDKVSVDIFIEIINDFYEKI